MKKILKINNQDVEFEVISREDGDVLFVLNNNEYSMKKAAHVDRNLAVMLGAETSKIPFAKAKSGALFANINGMDVTIHSPIRQRGASENESSNSMVSPMPGKILKILVSDGDSVSKGSPLIIMEAMKMEHTIKASDDGIVLKVLFNEGEMVDGQVELVTFEEKK